MFITSKVDLPVLQVVEQGEGDKKKAVSLPGGLFPAGRHEVERIFNPVCPSGPRWLVLKGTKIGHAELVWKRWQDPVRGDRAVVITNEEHRAASSDTAFIPPPSAPPA